MILNKTNEFNWYLGDFHKKMLTYDMCLFIVYLMMLAVNSEYVALNCKMIDE
jgi:hypothetical protein